VKKVVLIWVVLWGIQLAAFAQSKESSPNEAQKEPIKIEASMEGGFYDEPIEVEFYSLGASVYLTTDGSLPVAGRSEHRYRGALKISETTTVRLLAVMEGEKSKIISHTYFIGEPESTFPTVSISITPGILFHPTTGLFVKGPNAIDTLWQKPGANFWSRKEVLCNVEIFETDGSCVFRSATGFRLFGGMSRLFPQKSMAIVAREDYGDNRIKHRIFGKEGLKKFKFLVLRNSGSDFGKTHFRDAFMTNLVKDWDLETQDFRPSHLYINGKYWGIYNIREKINRYFLADHFDVHKDSLDLLEHRLDRKRGSKSHYRRLLSYLQKTDLSDPANYAYVESLIDIDNFIDYNVAQIYFDNQDAGGNIRYWRPQTEDGRWRWILYDTDWGFGLHEGKAYQNNSLEFHTEPNGPFWPNPPWSTFMLRKMLENESFRSAFVSRFADHLNVSLAAFEVEQQLDYFENLYAPEIQRHIDRWQLFKADWDFELGKMRNFARKRPEFVRMHLMEKFDLGRQREVKMDVGEGGRVVINDHLEWRGEGFEGVYFEKVPLRLKAIPELGYRFSHWEGANLPEREREVLFELLEPSYEIRAVFVKYSHPLEEQLMINEVSANNKSSEDWVEIYNFSDHRIELKDWVFTDSKHSFTLPDVSIPPKDYLILCENAASFKNAFPDAYRFVGDFGFGLNKRREELGLYTPSGALVDKVTYEQPPTDSVFTLTLLLPTLDNTDPENWEKVAGVGTPNAANQYYVESSIQAKRRMWADVGLASGVILICIVLLFLRHRGTL
jgi:hypothetical protein